jgi:hypothetical protein
MNIQFSLQPQVTEIHTKDGKTELVGDDGKVMDTTNVTTEVNHDNKTEIFPPAEINEDNKTENATNGKNYYDHDGILQILRYLLVASLRKKH